MSADFRRLAQQPVLVGDTLRLRQFTLGDAYELSQLHTLPLMTRWLIDDADLQIRDVAFEFLYGLTKLYRQKPGLGIWAIEREECRYTAEQLSAEGALAMLNKQAIDKLLQPQWYLYGWFNLTPVPEMPMSVELGSRLHPALWGQQVACSVGQQLLEYACDVLSLPAVFTHCHPENRAALYCSSYLGFGQPESVSYQGRKAIRLVMHAPQHLMMSAMTSSKRRRQAHQTASCWTETATELMA